MGESLSAGSTVERPADGTARRGIARWSRSERRWLIRFACASLPLLGSLGLILIITVITYRDSPPWVVDVRVWRISGRIRLAMILIGGLQLLLTWGMGVLGAVSGAAGFTTRGALRPRLAVQRRRVSAGAWTILSLRLVLLLVLLLAGVFAFTSLLGRPFDASDLEHTLLVRPLLPLAAGFVLAIHLLAGPWLRLRYSLALGALAAAYTPSAARRRWSAVTARFGAGLIGVLALIWGSALITLGILTAFDPFYTNQGYEVTPWIFPHVPFSIGRVLTISLVVAVALGIYTAGQIALPVVYLWLAERRARRGRAAGQEAG
jgi:hypothetical protein